MAKAEGYGYLFGAISNIVFYNSSGLGWSKTEFKQEPESISAAFFNKFDDFNYSENFEGGIALRLSDNVSVQGCFERNMVYSSHMFWYWALSKLIEQFASGGLDFFLTQVMKSSPSLLPIVYFVLKNALYFGFSELRKDDMNWPVDTAPPMFFDRLKAGIAFHF